MLLEIPLLCAFCGLLIRWFLAPGDRKRTEVLILTYMAAMPALLFAEDVLVWMVGSIAKYRLVRYDLYAFQFDRYLGNPSFVLGRWVASSHALTLLVAEIYQMPLLVMVAIYTIYVYRKPGEKGMVVKTFFISLFAQVPIYLLYPVCGPKYAFANFPQQPGPLVTHPIALAAVPNGVPSIHATLAFLCAALVWPWKAGKVFGSIFVVLTLITIMANGEHYAFDLLCAIPYTWLVWKLGHYRRARVSVRQVDEIPTEIAAG